MTASFAPRDAAKAVVGVLVASKASDVASDIITDHSSLEEDSKTVRISSTLIGLYVAAKLQPVTDKAVDLTADFIVAQRAKRKSKKDNPSEEK